MEKLLMRSTQKLCGESCCAGYRVVEKWSCKFSDEDRRQANEFGLESKVPQLMPKDALYGGRTEAINLQTALTGEDIQNGKEILYYDVISEYPRGHPTIFLKHQVPQTNDGWQKCGFFGVALCTIVPPKKLLHPLLPFRHQGVLMFPLYSVERNEDFCQHGEKEQAFTGVWNTNEIDRAIKLGYRLTKVSD